MAIKEPDAKRVPLVKDFDGPSEASGKRDAFLESEQIIRRRLSDFFSDSLNRARRRPSLVETEIAGRRSTVAFVFSLSNRGRHVHLLLGKSSFNEIANDTLAHETPSRDSYY